MLIDATKVIHRGLLGIQLARRYAEAISLPWMTAQLNPESIAFEAVGNNAGPSPRPSDCEETDPVGRIRQLRGVFCYVDTAGSAGVKTFHPSRHLDPRKINGHIEICGRRL
jgi:hypothetical protein